jgi:8-oxo-dGTP pyrophosphatase MutT (NUDIX family)
MVDARAAIIALSAASALLAAPPLAARHDAANPDHIDAAGCLIVTPDGFVMSINRLINRLQLPAGRHVAGETARETAARETREETGLKVEVGETLLRLKDGSVVFFSCAPADGNVDYEHLEPVDRVEVSRALVVNPVTMTAPGGEAVTTPWRFPEMHWLLKTLFHSVAEHAGG